MHLHQHSFDLASSFSRFGYRRVELLLTDMLGGNERLKLPR
jgi:hypothetical protein